MELWVHKNSDSNGVMVIEHVWGIASQGTSSSEHEFKVSKVIPEKSIVYIKCESVTQADSDISAGFDGYLIDN